MLYCYFVHQLSCGEVVIESIITPNIHSSRHLGQNTRAHTYIRNKKDMSSSTPFSPRAPPRHHESVPSTSNRRERASRIRAFSSPSATTEKQIVKQEESMINTIFPGACPPRSRKTSRARSRTSERRKCGRAKSPTSTRLRCAIGSKKR